MRASVWLMIVVLGGAISACGCSGTPVDGSRFNLPSFDAPEQTEPPLEGLEQVEP